MRIDLHAHSDVSDGTDDPAGLVAAAATAGLDVVALTDHDTMAGVDVAKIAGESAGVTVIRGVEITCEFESVTVHLLGLGCDPADDALALAMADVRQGRVLRLPRMVAALNAAGIGITEEDVLAQITGGATPGRPHVADAMVALGVVRDRQEAFDQWLDVGRPGYIGHVKVDLTRGIELVAAAGGASVLAHAWGRQSRRVLPAAVIAHLAAAGLDCLEVDHQLHDAETRAALREISAATGLVQTGSSDYHGTGKVNHDLGCNLTPESSFDAIRSLVEARGGRL